jgi:hypothetical protein
MLSNQTILVITLSCGIETARFEVCIYPAFRSAVPGGHHLDHYPHFIVIALGALARQRGFIPPAFLEPANRMVYYLAIPAMIFRAISRSSIGTEFNLMVITATLICVAVTFGVALLTAYALVNRREAAVRLPSALFMGTWDILGWR